MSHPDRPFSLRPAFIGLVVVGGAFGTLARAVLEAAFPHPTGTWPWTTFAINLGGALLLSFLTEWLSGLGPDTGWRRALRIGGGTGVVGGFTTYSTFALETTGLMQHGQLPLAAAYGVASVLCGVLVALVGIRLAQAIGSSSAERGHR